MHLLSVLVAFLGSFLLVKATGENPCTTTAVVSVTTNVLTPRSSMAPEAESTGFVANSGSIATLLTSQAESTGIVTNPGPIGTHSFSSIPTTNPLTPLTGSALSSLASAVQSSSYPYTLSFGPGGGIHPTNATTVAGSTTVASSTSTATSTSSASASTTSTSTSSTEATTTAAASTAAAASTGAQPASGAVATAIPAANGANLALAVVAGDEIPPCQQSRVFGAMSILVSFGGEDSGNVED
ncbi:MAG: hypothetical protein Q9188_003463 [Gyalolechia gomerana]